MLDGGGARYIGDAEARVDASGGAGSFEFNPDGVQQAIDKVLDIVDRFEMSKQEAGRLSRRLPTDVDPVSREFVSAAERFGDGYVKWDEEYIERLKDFGRKLVKIREGMLAREDELGAAFNKAVND